jgi:hypothetical protein
MIIDRVARGLGGGASDTGAGNADGGGKSESENDAKGRRELLISVSGTVSTERCYFTR